MLDLKINEFEGPLDLLLHLIKENKMDIFDIKIEEITNQYISYLEGQKKMNLEVTSEYLVLATELIEIKSKMLLPHNEEIIEEDPRTELIDRLLEYEAYKEITKTLKEKEEIRQEIYTKLPSNMDKYLDENTNIQLDVNLDDLLDAFEKFLNRKQASKPLKTKITSTEITVTARKYDIKNILKREKKISFFKLFPEATKEYIVATFLAVLEMVKEKQLMIIQNDTFDDIICEEVKHE